MPRFDVYRGADESGYLLDVQADLLNHFSTCVVVPLIRRRDVPPPVPGLNPVFRVQGEEWVMATHLLAAVPRAILKEKAANLSDHHIEIVQAIDVLLQGF